MTSHATPKIIWLSVRELLPHPKVQRTFSEAWAKEIADTLDPDKIDIIAVVRDRGHYYVVDGQHRVAAVKMALGEDQRVQCQVFDDADTAKAADVFLGRNSRLGVRSIDKFLQRVNRGDDAPKAISGILKRYGLNISLKRGTNVVQATAACEAVYRKNPATFEHTIGVLHQAWGGEPDAYNGELLRGVGAALVWNPDIDHANLSERLATTTPTAVLAKASVLRDTQAMSKTNATADVVIGLYNRGRRRLASRSTEQA